MHNISLDRGFITVSMKNINYLFESFVWVLCAGQNELYSLNQI